MPSCRYPRLEVKALFLTVALICIGSVNIFAQVPEYFTFQGLITDPAGIPVTGYHTVTVRLYDGGAQVYSQTEGGTTADGMFNMHVGPLHSVVFGKPLQLGFTVDADPEMPRVDLASAPYALGLRALRVEHATTADRPPNLIGGAATNSTDSTRWGITIGGGGGYGVDQENRVEVHYGTIGGGYGNLMESGDIGATTIAGGHDNFIGEYGFDSAIGGGSGNEIIGFQGVIGGGSDNKAGNLATVGGGSQNSALGNHAIVPGGLRNKAAGHNSFAAGSYARALQNGTFVWQDATATTSDDTLATFGANQFRVRASGGFYFQTAAAKDLGTGARLSAGSGTWAELSSEASKTAFQEIDTRDYLERVALLDVKQWSYKTEDPAVTHVGPMAEEFYAAFGHGPDEQSITTIDGAGVALAAIQGLYEVVKEQQIQIEKLRELQLNQE